MSLLLDYIEKPPNKTKRLIGITNEQLQELWTQAEALHIEKKAQEQESKITNNLRGAGCKKNYLFGNKFF